VGENEEEKMATTIQIQAQQATAIRSEYERRKAELDMLKRDMIESATDDEKLQQLTAKLIH
jgi:ribosomal protein L10